MKKLFATMLAVLATGASYALPVGNPSEASLLCDGLFWEGNCCDNSFDICDPCINWCDAFSLRVGFYGDYVFNRHMEHPFDNDPSLTSTSDGVKVEHTEIYTNAGYLALNFWNRLDIFSTLGATNLYLNSNALRFVDPAFFAALDGSRIEIETDSRFSWSVGGRLTLWECGCTALGFEGQYFRTNTHVKRITIGADDSVYTDGNTENDRARYSEWQVGLGLSHRINVLVPYVAVKYARSSWNFGNDAYTISSFGLTAPVVTPGNLIAANRWGYAVGVSLVDCEKMALNVEGRFGDEKAVSVLGQIRF